MPERTRGREEHRREVSEPRTDSREQSSLSYREWNRVYLGRTDRQSQRPFSKDRDLTLRVTEDKSFDRQWQIHKILLDLARPRYTLEDYKDFARGVHDIERDRIVSNTDMSLGAQQLAYQALLRHIDSVSPELLPEYQPRFHQLRAEFDREARGRIDDEPLEPVGRISLQRHLGYRESERQEEYVQQQYRSNDGDSHERVRRVSSVRRPRYRRPTIAESDREYAQRITQSRHPESQPEREE